jgi:hypothetical protein
MLKIMMTIYPTSPFLAELFTFLLTAIGLLSCLAVLMWMPFLLIRPTERFIASFLGVATMVEVMKELKRQGRGKFWKIVYKKKHGVYPDE